MKKTFGILSILVVFCLGMLGTYLYYYSGTTYYTRVTTVGTSSEHTDDSGNVDISYTYQLPSYTEGGDKKTLSFNSFNNKEIRQDAYLKLVVNDRKGVLSWEEVSKDEVPQKAREKLAD